MRRSMQRSHLGPWVVYLVIAVCLTPVVVPPGPGRTAIVDSVNAIALAVFTVLWLPTKRPVKLPFLVPMLLIAVGSVLATFNAVNPGAAIITLIQDAYLYVIFVMLVDLLGKRGDFAGLRLAWVFTASAIAILGIYQAVMFKNPSLLNLVSPKGFRALGTFDQPDTLSDYLVMSIFMVLSLNEEAGRLVRWSAIAIMGIGIVATKANGGIMAMAAGLMAWAVVRAWTKRVSYTGLIAGALFALSLGLAGVWLIQGVGVGSGEIKELQAHSILGRMGHSSKGRMQIWGTLRRRYLKTPLGYGPGNSRWQVLTIEERDRPTVGPTETFDTGADPFVSKEAHNDYIAFLFERGPLALLAMLALKLQVFGRITKWWAGRAESVRGRVRGGAMAAAMFGAWVASWITSNTIEVLHFRHVWLFLAMVCALGPIAGEAGKAQPGEASEQLPV